MIHEYLFVALVFSMMFNLFMVAAVYPVISRLFFRGNINNYFNDCSRNQFWQFPVILVTPLPLQLAYLFWIRQDIVDYVATKDNQCPGDD